MKITIIGGGPGGYVAAIRAAQLGAEVVLIEKDQIGGTCLNRGCIPTKALYRNAEVMRLFDHCSTLGIEATTTKLHMAQVIERKDGIVSDLVKGIHQLLKGNHIELIQGEGSLINAHTVWVKETEGKEYQLKTDFILIATGSRPSLPPIEGAQGQHVLTSKEWLMLKEVPQSIAIIGGGVIGVEFASIFNAFGSEITIIETQPTLIPNADKDISKRIQSMLKKQGVKLMLNTRVDKLESFSDNVKLHVTSKTEDKHFCADKVLISTGRQPVTEGLNLEQNNIKYNKKGICVNAHYQTNVPSVYAIGDVIGGIMLAHVASEEGKTAIEHMVGISHNINYQAVPSAVFTFPEIAWIGLTEKETKDSHIEYSTSKFYFRANSKALTLGESEGFIKIIADKIKGKLLGVHIIGPHASDLIHEASLAITNGLTAHDIEKTIHAHPTLSEAFHEAVLGLDGLAIHAAPKRK